MKINQSIKVSGHISFKLFDKEGKLKDAREIKNVIVTTGKNFLAAWLIAATQSDYFMRYIAIGTGTTAAQASDTALETEVGTRVAGALSSALNVWESVAVFGPGNGTGSITEAGILSDPAAGTMLARQTFGVLTKDAGDSLQVSWAVTFS